VTTFHVDPTAVSAQTNNAFPPEALADVRSCASLAALPRNGWSAEAPSVCIWEGAVPYLQQEGDFINVLDTLRDLLSPGSVLALDGLVEDEEETGELGLSWRCSSLPDIVPDGRPTKLAPRLFLHVYRPRLTTDFSMAKKKKDSRSLQH
jgi:hypothetical protein